MNFGSFLKINARVVDAGPQTKWIHSVMPRTFAFFNAFPMWVGLTVSTLSLPLGVGLKFS